MNRHLFTLAGSLLLALAACAPTAEYTESESPKTLRLDNASVAVDVGFAPRSAQLLPRDATKLRVMAARGDIAPGDRVTVSAGGGPDLAAARFQTISHELVAYNIVASEAPAAAVAPNRAVIMTGRYLVTAPPCPNWSKPSPLDFTNTLASNYGCADAVNLARMVARPAEFAEGTPLGRHYDVNSTIQNPVAVFAAGGAIAAPATGTTFAATPGAITNALNVVGCPTPLATGSVQSTGATQAGQQAQITQTQQNCATAAAPSPIGGATQ